MGFTESSLEGSMRAERELERECGLVFEDGVAAAQRFMARVERRMFEDMMIVKSMLAELRLSGVLSDERPR